MINTTGTSTRQLTQWYHATLGGANGGEQDSQVGDTKAGAASVSAIWNGVYVQSIDFVQAGDHSVSALMLWAWLVQRCMFRHDDLWKNLPNRNRREPGSLANRAVLCLLCRHLILLAMLGVWFPVAGSHPASIQALLRDGERGRDHHCSHALSHLSEAIFLLLNLVDAASSSTISPILHSVFGCFSRNRLNRI